QPMRPSAALPMKHLQRHQCIDRRAIDYFSQVDEFVRSVRHLKPPRTVSVGWNALRCIVASLQKAGAHLKMGRLARNRAYAASQSLAERLIFAERRGLPFLKNFPFDRDAVALAASQRGDQLPLFLRKVFLRIDAPVDGEPALVRHHVEVSTTAALSSQHQDGMACLICPDMETGSFLLHLSLQLLKPLNDLNHPFERVFALVLQADVRRFPEHPNA